jgi:glutamate-1-semialdehyde 2,1-aminomutase
MAARFPLGAFPIAAERGDGARIQDVDGNWLVDWSLGLGAITLGYGKVDGALGQALAEGRASSFSLPHMLEVSVAERLCEKIPCAEMVRFVSTGSEATEAAIRTARIATGRNLILTVKNGYHSWHSWFSSVKDFRPGIPPQYTQMVGTFTYNDFDSLTAWSDGRKKHWYGSEQPAAVILEPTLFEAPAEGFLQSIRDWCTSRGILLIFDEVVCGGRWAYGGGQEYFGVTPDLATLGKGLANGLPIGILCGKREYMRHAELISGTFGGNALSLAAVNAVLDVYEKEPVIETMWSRGRALQNNLGSYAAMTGVPMIVDGYPCKPRIRFEQLMPSDPHFTRDDQRGSYAEWCMALFLQVTAEHGALFHPGGFNVCYALTDEDMLTTAKAIDEGCKAVKRALETGDWSALKGKLCTPVVTVRS